MLELAHFDPEACFVHMCSFTCRFQKNIANVIRIYYYSLVKGKLKIFYKSTLHVAFMQFDLNCKSYNVVVMEKLTKNKANVIKINVCDFGKGIV